MATCPLIQGRNWDVQAGWFPFKHSTMPCVVALTTCTAASCCHVWLPDSLLWHLAWHCVVGEVWEDINCSICAASWSNWSSNCLFSSFISDTRSVSWEIVEFCDAMVVASMSLVFCFSASLDWFVNMEFFKVDFSVLFLWLTSVLTIETESSNDSLSAWVHLCFGVGTTVSLNPLPNISHWCWCWSNLTFYHLHSWHIHHADPNMHQLLGLRLLAWTILQLWGLPGHLFPY